MNIPHQLKWFQNGMGVENETEGTEKIVFYNGGTKNIFKPKKIFS